MRIPETRAARRTRLVMVIAALAMVALLLFGALAIDVGAVWSSRTQSQNAGDAAALAAAQEMIQQSGHESRHGRARRARDAEGISFAGANSTVANSLGDAARNRQISSSGAGTSTPGRSTRRST